MRENEDLLGDDDDDETALDDSTVREGEVIEASAKPWQSPAVGENIPPPENASDNNDKSDTIQEHFKKLGAADAAAPVLSSELEARSSATTDQVSNKSKEFMAVGMAEPVDEEAAIPNNNNNEQDGTNNNSKSRSLNQGVSWREKRFWDAKKIFIVVIALLVVVAIAGALGATLGGGGGDDKNSTPSQANTENDDAVSRDPTDYGQGTGIVSGVGVVNDSPTISPKEDSTPVDNSTPDNGIISAGDDTCIMNTFDTGVNTQQLEGVRSLSANYPKVAIDGNKAVVASGSGYVAFFEFNPTTNVWKRTEVFGLIANVGEVNSVAISGNVAVIGAPEAVTDISDDDPLKTGAVFIYEFDDTTLFEWRQKKGAYIPNDYKRATMDTYDGANFGQSVDVDGDLIVVGAPEENTNRGSITIFRRDDTSNEWVELKRMKPDDKLCGAEFFGYTVSIYEDVVAASADCDINIVVYKAQRDDDSGISIIPFQQLEYKDPSYGAVSSIAMSWDTLAYSTVSGGLFFYKRDNRDKRFFESQVMRFDVSQSLYEYPLTMDANMLVLAVMNDIFMYTHDAASKEWRQELLVLNSSGDYAGYVGASVSLSDGQLLAADRREVNAHDFTECLLTEEEFLVTTTIDNTSGGSSTSSCNLCPNGIAANYENYIPFDNDTQTCQELIDNTATWYNEDFDESCELSNYVQLFCCPDDAAQAGDFVGDNSCTICPNGITKGEDYTPFIADGDTTTTCKGLVDEVNFFGSDFCDGTSIYEMLCCPSEDREPCTLCPNGLTVSDDYVPTDFGGDATCKEVVDSTALTLTKDDESCEGSKIIEVYCCPVVQENPCLICPNGLSVEKEELEFADDGTTCKEIVDFYMALDANSGLCLEALGAVAEEEINPCCPSSSGGANTAPPVPPTPPSDSDCDGHTLTIDVTLDQYPTDTRWEIIPQGQSTAIATSAPYDASLQFSPAETDSVCLPDGTYDFIIYDVYGDGICCDWGEGSYQLAFGDDIVASGGSFGKSETKTFSTPAASSTPPDPDCYPVSVSLNFDMYPQDESWDITQGGVIVASSSPVAADAKEDTQEVCLPAGDYVFTIYDVYGDGMCCQWGEGKYTVTTVPLQSSNVVIVEGAEFAASESTSFTLPKF